MSSTRCVPTRLNTLASPRGHAFDGRQHEARGVEDGAQRADPRQVVVARPEEAEQRVGDVRIEDLGGPALPDEEQVRQPAREIQLGVVLEQRHRGWRSPGRSLQHDDLDLPALVRAVQREEERHDERDGAEPGDGRGGGEEARQRAVRDDVAEPEGQERRGGEVDGGAEIGRDRPQLVTEGEQDQPVADDQGGQPGDEQGDDHRRREQAEDPVARRVGSSAQNGSQHAPRAAHDVPGDPEPARRRAGDDDRLEEVPEGERDQEQTEGEEDRIHRSSIIPRPRAGGVEPPAVIGSA